MSEIVQYIISNKKDLCKFSDSIDKELTGLSIYAEIPVDLQILNAYPNLKILHLNGKFTGFSHVAALEHLESLALRRMPYDEDHFNAMMNGRFTSLELFQIRKLTALHFIEKASNLRKLYLSELPSVTALPNLGSICALKICDLHKLDDMNSLIDSHVRYLFLSLCADKISGTAIGEILAQMPELEKASVDIDRSPRRETVIINRLKKCGREHLADTEGFLCENWSKL